MITTDPNRSIDYPPELHPGPLFPAVLLWVGLLYTLPLLAVAYYGFLLPRGALLALPGQPPVPFATGYAVLGGLLVLLLLLGYLRFYTMHLADVGERETETRLTLLALADRTGLGGWDRAFLFLAVGGLFVLHRLGLAGPLEGLFVLVAALGVAFASRELPRFPARPRPNRLPYEAQELQQLFAQPEGPEVALVEFRWRLDEHPYLSAVTEKEFAFAVPVRRESVQAARQRPRELAHPRDALRLVEADWRAPELSLVAARLREQHLKANTPPFVQAENVLAFCRQFRLLRPEPEAEGFPRFPVETLADGEADQAGLVVLAATLLGLLGQDVALLAVDFERGGRRLALALPGGDDLPAEIRCFELGGKRTLYAEPAATGGDPSEWEWRLGTLPVDDLARLTAVPLDAAFERPHV